VAHKFALHLLVLGLVVTSLTGQSVPVIRTRVSEVRLTLVALDGSGRPLPTLSPADIAVFEDGRPISAFDLRSANDLALRMGVLIDLSDSTSPRWNTVRRALIDSLPSLLGPDDGLFLLTFDSKIELERTVTDPAQLESLVASLRGGGLTSLYDAVYHACRHPIFEGDRQPHRSALLLFSDGEDNLSRHDLLDTIAEAELMGVSIYTISTHDPKRPLPGDAVLQELAASTGGRDFVVKDAVQLRAALAAIHQELRSSYLLYYRPPETVGRGLFRRVRVLPAQNNGARIRSRQGYFAEP
jgi:Ca-activated chloride channel homolog